MERRSFIKIAGAAGFIAALTPSEIVQAFEQQTGSKLEASFFAPPVSAFPQVYWFWMNGNITKEGITQDLEAMKKVGIGGVFNFDVGTGIPKGPITYLSAAWIELKKHAIKEAERLGLEFTMHNCPGWSSSGGPWITPELAMQQITWNEAYVSGGKSISIKMPKPATRLHYYNDIAVIAYPSLKGEELLQTLKIHSSSGPVDKEQLTDENSKGVTVHPQGNDQPAWLLFEFREPYEASLITFYISAIATAETENIPLEFGERTSIALESSDDGVEFRLVTRINTGLETELVLGDKFIAYDIPVTRAKYYRLTSSKTRRYKQVQLSGITRLKNWMEKTNTRGRYIMFVDEPSTIHHTNHQQVPESSLIDLNSVLDISPYLDEKGILNWNAPPGNWTILRIGFTPTGTLNRAAPETGIGLECDKYNPNAISFHFHKMMEHFLPVINAMGPGKKIGLEIDSYEAGAQNWTHGFDQVFKKRWQYDIHKYLPILTGGRMIGSVDTTERFLWDLRRLQGDLIAENYYGKFHQLCAQHGITSYIEPYDAGPMEEMQIGSRVNVNIGEFWFGVSSVSPVKHPATRTSKLAASIAHINSQNVTGAEAFTAEPDAAKWQEYPFAMKAVGDKIFTRGVNRMIIHRYAHQPHTAVLPGMTMGPWGIHFDRTNTWWYQSKAWLTYLSRCQFMLQQGRFAADLLYFTGEDANMYTGANPDQLFPTPPHGYDYDVINAEQIFKQVKIVKGQIVLQNGMTYRVFVLQNYKAVTVALLKQLRELVKKGMILVGAKPERSLGLSGFEVSDAAFQQIADELWGKVDGKTITAHSFGKGHIYWGQPLLSILQQLNIKPDFEFSSRSGDAPVLYTHRKIKGGDIYFLSNQRRTYEDVVCTFRVQDQQPEIWDPVTGKIVTSVVYELEDGRIRLPLQLEPYGSLFILFRSKALKEHLHAVVKDNATLLGTQNFSIAPRKLYADTTNTFTICFWAKPEINVLLNPSFIMGTISEPWTEFYAIYPPSGKVLYGEGHATCGIAVGRNGLAVWEHALDKPVLVLSAPTPISGWSHITLVYNGGTPSVYVNGLYIKKGAKSRYAVHPALDKAFLTEGASYYNGDMSKPVLFREPLDVQQMKRLASEKVPLESSPFKVEMAGDGKPALLFKENGHYELRTSRGKTSFFTISNIMKPIDMEGPWLVRFPPGYGAPAQIVLPELGSLHLHSDPSVRYFSGTATYQKELNISKDLLTGQRWLLDLGRVEVIAEVSVNGSDFGILWKRPYSIDITDALKTGINRVEVKVTNQWPNRLIGDEQLPDPDAFTPGASASGMEGLTGGSIERLPQWFIKGQPKPADGRITFATWKHYTKDSPLLESGLIGPVILRPAILQPL